jgi:prolipoprotein diacylglyceryl transferase
MEFSKMLPLATIPSPAQGVWHLGPVPLRAYALCILVGIAVAILITQRRWKARGGDPVIVIDIATWAVPFGVVGGRIYHVITSPEAYFGKGGDPIKALYIWQGGLGIWGAVVLGGVGAWIGCRRSGVKLPAFADAVAPGIVVAQAIGRVGNWFNNELYGRATDLPWGLQIHEWNTATGEAARDNAGNPEVLGYYHPAFLYESLWDIFTAIILIVADRRWKLGHGRVFALYIAVYSIGRGWIETLRIDEANHILGLRLNVWTAIVVFVGGLTYFIVSARRRPGRETEVNRVGKNALETTSGDADGSSDSPDVSSVKSKVEAKDEDKGKAKDDKSEGEAKSKTEDEKAENAKAPLAATSTTAGSDKIDSTKADSTRAGSTKADSTKADSTKVGTTTVGSKVDSTKVGTDKAAVGKAAAGNVAAGKVGTDKDKAAEVKDDTAEKSPASAPTTDAKVKDDPAGTDKVSTDKSSPDNSSTDKSSTEKADSDIAKDDKSDKTVITVESPANDAGAKNAATAGPPKPQ